jgi:hypothetical protein
VVGATLDGYFPAALRMSALGQKQK